MNNLSITVNAASLFNSRFPLWLPAIEAFTKEKVTFLYVDSTTPEKLCNQIEIWCKTHAPHLTLIHSFDDLNQSDTECFVSFEPPQNDQFKSFKKIQCWAVDPLAFEKSLELCLNLGASIIFTDHVIEELPKVNKHHNLLLFENLFHYIPPSISNITFSQKRSSSALFFYNSNEDAHLENFIHSLKKTNHFHLVDLAKEKNPSQIIINSLQEFSLTIAAFHNPQWIFFLKMLAAAHQLNIAFWNETHLSPVRQIAFGLEPLSYKKKLHLLHESIPDRLDRLTSHLNTFNNDQAQFPTILSEDVFKESIAACHPFAIANTIEKKLNQLTYPNLPSTPPSTYHEWVLFSTYGDHPEFPWWHSPSAFIPLETTSPTYEENPTLLRLAHTFLEAYEREPFDSKIRHAYGNYRDRLYQSYVRKFLLHHPCNEWLQHFSRCYFRFTDWIPTCEKIINTWYEEATHHKGAYSLVGIGLVEGVLGAYYKASPENALLQKAEYLIDKDFDLDRINWKFASHRALISLIKGNIDQATYFVNKIYSLDSQVKDGFSRLAHHIECKKNILQAIQWYDEDFESKRQTLPYQLQYLKLLAKHKYLEKAFEVIEAIYRDNQDKKILGLEAAIHFFHPNWYSLYDPNKRNTLAPQAKKCLQFLQLDRDYKREDVSNYALEAYWKLYSLDFDCIEDIYQKLQTNLGATTSYPSRTALILWALGQTTLARKIIEREALSDLKLPNDIHHYAVANALLGHRDLVKKGFHKLHNEHKHYFTTNDDPHPYKWFYQALAYKAVYAIDKAERYLMYAREWDPLINEAKILLERTHPQIDEPDLIPNFPEPQLISTI